MADTILWVATGFLAVVLATTVAIFLGRDGFFERFTTHQAVRPNPKRNEAWRRMRRRRV
ncbi:hypothetical protein [Lacticaseibacillus parakribbianus]|uniref:hypothetical protein n=1 Tax=Lacticaseibacillus parakribbianus TaxID=2970927 RepID=UPI0021CB4041|nr:hypothetical protein [Lacticaseibacillus parakribbianus]